LIANVTGTAGEPKSAEIETASPEYTRLVSWISALPGPQGSGSSEFNEKLPDASSSTSEEFPNPELESVKTATTSLR
jgi:hypothetical protein